MSPSYSVFADRYMGFKAFCSQNRLKNTCRAANHECKSEYSSEYYVFADRYIGFKAFCSQDRLKPTCRAANNECSGEYSGFDKS